MPLAVPLQLWLQLLLLSVATVAAGTWLDAVSCCFTMQSVAERLLRAGALRAAAGQQGAVAKPLARPLLESLGSAALLLGRRNCGDSAAAHLPVSAPSDWFSNSTICCSRSISTISGATSSRKVVLAIQAALPVDLQAAVQHSPQRI